MQARNITRIATVTASIAAVGLILAIAAPAEAIEQYSPRLSRSATPVAKVVDASLPFTPSTAKKKLSREADTRTVASETRKADAILARLIEKHPILKGTTVEIGNARGYQALAYYKSGRIVVSPDHKASLERILNHEVWHVIDYRDNGQIDWGENVPRG